MKSEYQSWLDELNGVREFNVAPWFAVFFAIAAVGGLMFLTVGRV